MSKEEKFATPFAYVEFKSDIAKDMEIDECIVICWKCFSDNFLQGDYIESAYISFRGGSSVSIDNGAL